MKSLQTLALLFILIPVSGYSQSAFDFKGEATNPILKKLGVDAEKPLVMGWVITPDTMISDINISYINVYSSSNKVLNAKLIGPLTTDEMAVIRKKSCVACDTTLSYYKYQLEAPVRLDGERVLVTSALPDARIGFEKIKMTNFLIKRAATLLGAEGLLHKYLYLRSLDGKYTYSFHAFYDPKSKVLKKYGILLHKRGVLLAQDAHEFDPAKNCEGCPVPTFNDPLDDVYLPINMIDTTVLPCPLMLVGTSSAEGRGMSLITFDTDGVKSEVKAAESVVNCCK